MKALCGWFSTRPVDGGVAILRAMLGAGAMSASEGTAKTTPHAALAVQGGQTHCLEHDGFIVAWIGHPRVAGARAGTGAHVLDTLRAKGRQGLECIGGDFALCAWDERTRRGFLAVDRLGMQQLVVAPQRDGLVFASTLDLLGSHPQVRRELSHQALFDYLYHHVSPGPQTVFSGLQRIAPGHCIEFGEKGAAPPAPYWSIRFVEERHPRADDLSAEFVSVLESAVRDAADGPACGAFLSGGTDSSTVSGMLSRVGGRPVRTFSIGFDVDGYDEMEYARIAAQHFGCEHHEYYVTPRDVVDILPKIAASYDQPFGNASAVPTYYCAKFAREHGVQRLLAGDGGDELFGGNERYAKQHLLGLYQRVPQALRGTLIEPLLLSLPGVQHVPPLRKLRSYVEQARPPMPARYESYNLLMHLGVDRVFTPDFLASVDTGNPARMMEDAHAPVRDASLINQMLAIDLRFILADGDLPKVTRMCDLAGVDVAFPLLDERVVEFSQKLPAGYKLKGTQLRWFFKHALRDFLPPAVITKKKHGFGMPVGAWLTEHRPLFDLAVDSINVLRPHGIVQPRFVDELLGTRLREHPAYFGTMVWVLMMLGLWLQSRRL